MEFTFACLSCEEPVVVAVDVVTEQVTLLNRRVRCERTCAWEDDEWARTTRVALRAAAEVVETN